MFGLLFLYLRMVALLGKHTPYYWPRTIPWKSVAVCAMHISIAKATIRRFHNSALERARKIASTVT